MPRAVAAIVPAAGWGTRLASPTGNGSGAVSALRPKALRPLAGRTMLQRSIDALSEAVDEIVVAVPTGYVGRVDPESAVPVSVIAGGETRQESVRLALAGVSSTVTHVLVHDAARALVPVDVVRRVREALDSGAACVVPVIAISDSLRGVAPGGPTPRSTAPRFASCRHRRASRSTR